MICDNCGSEMRYLKEEHTALWICDQCGNGVATTIFDPIEVDVTDYHISICESVTSSVGTIKVVSGIAKCNYIEAKRMIENAPLEIFCGKAIECLSVKQKLDSANIKYSITPDFPY